LFPPFPDIWWCHPFQSHTTKPVDEGSPSFCRRWSGSCLFFILVLPSLPEVTLPFLPSKALSFPVPSLFSFDGFRTSIRVPTSQTRPFPLHVCTADAFGGVLLRLSLFFFFSHLQHYPRPPLCFAHVTNMATRQGRVCGRRVLLLFLILRIQWRVNRDRNFFCFFRKIVPGARFFFPFPTRQDKAPDDSFFLMKYETLRLVFFLPVPHPPPSLNSLCHTSSKRPSFFLL